jgi:hypothetical protein
MSVYVVGLVVISMCVFLVSYGWSFTSSRKQVNNFSSTVDQQSFIDMLLLLLFCHGRKGVVISVWSEKIRGNTVHHQIPPQDREECKTAGSLTHELLKKERGALKESQSPAHVH